MVRCDTLLELMDERLSQSTGMMIMGVTWGVSLPLPGNLSRRPHCRWAVQRQQT